MTFDQPDRVAPNLHKSPPLDLHIIQRGYNTVRPDGGGPDMVCLVAFLGSIEVGHAVFSWNGGSPWCQTINVEEAYRRNGIREAVYAYAEYLYGRQLRPSPCITPSTERYFRRRGIFIPPDCVVKSPDEWE